MADEELESAKKLIAERNKKDITDCNDEMKLILEKYGCEIIVAGEFIGGQINSRTLIIKKQQ